MRRCATWAGGLVLGLGLLFTAQPAQALIKRLVPLNEYLQEPQFIVTVKIESIDPDPEKPRMVLAVEEDLKDKVAFRRMPINLALPSDDGAKEEHVAKLLKRVTVKQTMVVFVQQRGKKFYGTGYTNGTWFVMTGEGDPVRWRFLNCEPYLRRTFKGTTEEMQKAVADGLAGKTKPPEPDEKVDPGLGPEVKPEEKKDKPPEEGRLPGNGYGSGPLFAVIPTGAIGGLIAILALFFPALFGGLALTMKRWIAALSVLSFNSTLLCVWVTVRWWFGAAVDDAWWCSPLALWTAMTVVTVLGITWSWRRHLATLHADNGTAGAASGDKSNGNGTPSSPVPGRAEMIGLSAMSVVGIGMVLSCLLLNWSLFDDTWSKPLLVMWIGCWMTTLYALVLVLSARRGRVSPALLPAEGVLLGALGVASLGLGIMTVKPAVAAGEPNTKVDDAAGAEGAGAKPIGVAWKWEAKDRGVIYSTPTVTKDHVFAAASHGSAFPFGRLYCIDRTTGKELWSFDDEGDMKQVFSSPAVVDGKVYVGEGFHQDHDCKMYCLDAATGEKKWSFATSSHTESSPIVKDGKVYFGAGDDGVFCLNAADGKEVWHFKNLHVDTNPAVVDGKLYAGSGVGDTYRDTCMFCLDAVTGKELWRVPSELPVWGSPTVSGQHVFFGLGNGDFTKSADRPAGAVMCLEAATGRRIWRADVSDGVLDRPAVDRYRVYFGSRDRHLYCVSRKDGTVLWKKDMGGPVVASVALARMPGTAAGSVYALGSTGTLFCFDPETGGEDYSFDVRKDANAQPELYSSLVVQMVPDGKGGVKRQIVFGAGLNNFVSRAAVVYCYEDRGPE